jgi:hypothetical protein
MFDVTVDVTKATADLRNIQQNQIPFAISLALNRTAKGAIAAAGERLDRDFTINESKKPFLKRLFRFPRSQWATKRKLIATVGVHQSDGDFGTGSDKDRGFLLGRHEAGGERHRNDPARPFFLPTEALRSGAFDVPPKSMYPTALRLFESRGIVRFEKDAATGKRKGVKGTLPAQAKGKKGTFIIDARKKGGTWGVFQRVGRGHGNLRMLWAFRTKIRLKQRLGFYTGTSAYVDTNFNQVFGESLAEAMRTAK